MNDRVIAMAFPVDKRPPLPPPEGITTGDGGGGAAAAVPPRKPLQQPAGNDLDVVAAVLRSRHAGHYMVWNVSEEGYDYGYFEDQVK